MMEDAKMYAISKILSTMKNRPNPYVNLTDSESESDASFLLGQERFRNVKELSYNTLKEYCNILSLCIPFNSHLHARHKDSAVANCWCPCSPPIWNWLVSKVLSLQY